MPFSSKPLFVLPLLTFAAPTTKAADLVNPVPPGVTNPALPEVTDQGPPEVTQINYISVEGGYVLTDDGVVESGEDKFGDIEDEGGFYAAATYRRMFSPEWDMQITGSATWLNQVRGNAGGLNWFDADLDYQTADLDIGYHPGVDPSIRFLFGARLLHSTNSLYYSDPLDNERALDAEGWAIGPRIGFQSETMLGDSQFGFVAEASGSVLFGRFEMDRLNGEASSFDNSRTLYNLEALAGLSWHGTDNMTITAGYRAQQWWGLREETSISVGDYTLSLESDVLVHGPFARVGVSF